MADKQKRRIAKEVESVFERLHQGKSAYSKGEFYNDEFFISNLAVFKECRGKGVGTSLLKRAEEEAIEQGLDKLSLYTELDNSNAIKLYKKFGFREVGKVVLPVSYNKYDLFGYYKMLKELK